MLICARLTIYPSHLDCRLVEGLTAAVGSREALQYVGRLLDAFDQPSLTSSRTRSATGFFWKRYFAILT